MPVFSRALCTLARHWRRGRANSDRLGGDRARVLAWAVASSAPVLPGWSGRPETMPQMTATKIIPFPRSNRLEAADPLPGAGEMAVALPAVPRTVTFKAPFDLPGLAGPHRPGTYELRETRRALGVSWEAWQISLTLLLVDGGITQALDVSTADLDAALRLDRAAG